MPRGGGAARLFVLIVLFGTAAPPFALDSFDWSTEAAILDLIRSPRDVTANETEGAALPRCILPIALKSARWLKLGRRELGSGGSSLTPLSSSSRAAACRFASSLAAETEREGAELGRGSLSALIGCAGCDSRDDWLVRGARVVCALGSTRFRAAITW